MKEEDIPDSIPEIIRSEFKQREKNKNWLRTGLKVLQLLFIATIVLVLAFFYFRSTRNNKQAEIEKQKKSEQEAQLLEQANDEYIKALSPSCAKPVTEITALEFFRCKSVKEGYYIDVKSELENPELPSFCQRRMQELAANEFVDCLEEK